MRNILILMTARNYSRIGGRKRERSPSNRSVAYGGVGGDDMSRAIRDISVPARSYAEVMNGIMTWANSCKVKILQGQGNFLVARLHTMLWWWGPLAPKRLIEITVTQNQSSVLVHLEGYMKSMGKEDEFSPTAVMGAIPKRAGWKAMEELSQSVAATSYGLVQHSSMAQQTMVQQPPAGSPAYSAPGSLDASSRSNICGTCGFVTRPGAIFCEGCGRPIPQPGAPVNAQIAQSIPAQSAPSPSASEARTEVVTTGYCGNCGSPVKSSAKFCVKCGFRF